MKYRVVGWTEYDDDIGEVNTFWAARNAIIDDIKAHGYLFSGWAHQESLLCAPVLNDGKAFRCSQRCWGEIMAEAHGLFGRMDYAKYAFDVRDPVYPAERFDRLGFIPEDVRERFELEVTKKVFERARKGEIELDDLPQFRYIGEGDGLLLTCGGEKKLYTVTEVDREKDISEETEIRLHYPSIERDYSDCEERRLAEEEYARAPVVLTIALKLP